MLEINLFRTFFDCMSPPNKTWIGMAGMVSATARMGRCCWAEEPWLWINMFHRLQAFGSERSTIKQ